MTASTMIVDFCGTGQLGTVHPTLTRPAPIHDHQSDVHSKVIIYVHACIEFPERIVLQILELIVQSR